MRHTHDGSPLTSAMSAHSPERSISRGSKLSWNIGLRLNHPAAPWAGLVETESQSTVTGPEAKSRGSLPKWGGLDPRLAGQFFPEFGIHARGFRL
jgi:hypothetical protein